MHKEVRQERPGMCPECGMQLIKQKAEASVRRGDTFLREVSPHAEKGHDKHKGHRTESFLTKFWVAFALTIPILAYSELFEKAFGFSAPDFTGRSIVILALGSIVFFYCGWIFLASSYRELRARLPGMMTLIALAIVAAYAFSVYQVLRGDPHNLFWELSTLIAVMLLGHWIEMRAVQGAQGALRELAKLLPDSATVLRGGKELVIPLSELRVRDQVLVKPGERIPADGAVLEGASDVNESIATGESRPVPKAVGSEVIAGTINGDGSLTIEVSKIGEHTFLAGVMRLVADAQASKSRLQMLSDRAAFYLTVVAVAAGGITFVLWMFAEAGVSFAVERLVAVLVIACPHALGLAIPLVASISTTMAARNGFLVRQRLALEAARSIDVVLFDKTGTLTKGEFGVDAVIGSRNENNVLHIAASVNAHSEHPLGKAIVRKAKESNIDIAEVRDFARLSAGGVRGIIEGAEVQLGSARLLLEKGLAIPKRHQSEISGLSAQGKTVVHLLRKADAGWELVGSIALSDMIRAESREAIQMLKEKGVRVAMITGDSEEVAEWVSKELDIDEYFARVLPHEKSEKVKLLQSRGQKVAMVGDGVNDAPALTQSDLGIAIGAGTNVAIESAGIILMRSDPRDISRIVRLSQLMYSKMIQNLFWATGYNIVALPLAAGALAWKGIILQPAVAAILMSLSTVIVAGNAVLLRRRSLG